MLFIFNIKHGGCGNFHLKKSTFGGGACNDATAIECGTLTHPNNHHTIARSVPIHLCLHTFYDINLRGVNYAIDVMAFFSLLDGSTKVLRHSESINE
jgi:hypothetical protein